MIRMRPGTLLRTLGCGVIALITLEFCARVDDYVTYGAPLLRPYTIDQIYRFDSLGRRGRPNARYRKWKLNSFGYRGPEPGQGTVRIVTFGASETFGLYESPDNEWPRQLERRLNEYAGTKRFDVINAAYAGMPLSAMTPRVPEIAAYLHPRFALIYSTPANYISLASLQPEQTPAPQPFFQIRLQENVRTVLKQATPMPVQNWFRAREIARAVREYGHAMDRLPEQNVDRFTTDLDRLASALRSQGIEPVLLTHANRFHSPLSGDDMAVLTSWRKFYPMLQEQGFIDMEHRMNDAVVALGAAHRYVVIDTARSIPPGAANFADFVHFTDAGSARMAQVVAEGLLPVLPQYCTSAKNVVSRGYR